MEELLRDMLEAWQEERLEEHLKGAAEEKAKSFFREFLEANLDEYLKIADETIREEVIENFVQIAVTVYQSKGKVEVEQIADLLTEMAKQMAIGKAKREIINEIDRRFEKAPDEAKRTAKVLKTLINNVETLKRPEEAAKTAAALARSEATDYAAKKASKAAGEGVKKFGEMLREEGRGKGNSTYNRNRRELTDSATLHISEQAEQNVRAVLSGEKSVEAALRDTAVTTGRGVAEDYVKAHAGEYIGAAVDSASKSLGLKKAGRGHSLRNRAVDYAKNSVTTELTTNLIAVVGDVTSGRKDIATGVTDVAVETGKNVALDVGKTQGAEIIAKALKNLEKEAAKRIENQLARNVTTNALKKLGDANTVVQVAGAVYDIGTSIKAYMDGDIDGTQLLKDIGENGTEAVVSAVFAAGGAMVAGPLGAAIGSMVGSIATNMLYNGVLQAFEQAKQSKLSYERNHAMVEESIRLMRLRREQFEADVERLLGHRSEVINRSFAAMDVAIAGDDMDGFISGIENIVTEFGGEMQFHNMEEFDDFMMSDEAFKL